MLTSLRETIRKFDLLSPGDAVVVGVSGGADSTALLHALIALREEMNLVLYAAHVNHHLRGEADEDERFAAALCGEWRIPFSVFHADVRSEAKGQTIEEAARRLRYGCLYAALGERGANKIAVAHHRDDNAETVLLNVIRGAGLTGLCGIPPKRREIVRPLLETPRSAVEAYLQANNIPCRTDASNFDRAYTRNRIRHDVLPLVTAHINPKAAEVIARNAAWLRDEDALLEGLARESYEKCLMSDNAAASARDGETHGCKVISLDTKTLAMLPVSLQRRVVRHAIRQTAGHTANIHAAHIGQIISLSQNKTGRETHLPAGLRVRREYGRLIFNEQAPHAPTGFYYPLTPEIPIYIPEMEMHALLTLTPQGESEPFPKMKTARRNCFKSFSYDKVRTGLCLRTRRPGDCIHIKGVGTRKLQDYFTDVKTPRSQRDAVPLLADGSEILWVMDERGRTHSRYAAQGCETMCRLMVY
jgi:tRNA(Ile)-lysidine synthase